MVNLTYGALSGNPDSPSLNPLGTDVVATYDGVPYAYASGDVAWVLACAALIIFMLPGLGYLYSGLTRRKNALSLLFLCFVSLAVVSFQWFFIGYSLVFSASGGTFLGDGRNVGFRQVLERPIPESNNKLPEIVFAMYQMCFAALVPAVLLGAAAERSRILPAMIFIFCWTTLVYDPIAHWIWSSNGWAFKWGILDYAGGGPVEIASGIGGLAYSYFIGKRRGYGTERIVFKPSNVSQVVLGTVLLWVGWLGFNGGSCFAASLKAAMAVFVTNLAGSVGGITWLIMDYRLERKYSVVGFCTGGIAGLVAITPAAGFVGAPAGALIGLVSAAVSNLCTRLKASMRVDDPMDIFAVHALAGIVGLLMTGLFAQASVAANDGFSEIAGGWMDRNWIQLAKQLAWCAATVSWTFAITYAIMFVINLIPGCHFRASEEAEIVGIDEVDLGEFVADYAYHERDLEGNYKPLNDPPTRAPSTTRGPMREPKDSGGEKSHTHVEPLRHDSSSLDRDSDGQSKERGRRRGDAYGYEMDSYGDRRDLSNATAVESATRVDMRDVAKQGRGEHSKVRREEASEFTAPKVVPSGTADMGRDRGQ